MLENGTANVKHILDAVSISTPPVHFCKSRNRFPTATKNQKKYMFALGEITSASSFSSLPFQASHASLLLPARRPAPSPARQTSPRAWRTCAPSSPRPHAPSSRKGADQGGAPTAQTLSTVTKIVSLVQTSPATERLFPGHPWRRVMLERQQSAHVGPTSISLPHLSYPTEPFLP
jgi:hypothetical protein